MGQPPISSLANRRDLAGYYGTTVTLVCGTQCSLANDMHKPRQADLDLPSNYFAFSDVRSPARMLIRAAGCAATTSASFTYQHASGFYDVSVVASHSFPASPPALSISRPEGSPGEIEAH